MTIHEVRTILGGPGRDIIKDEAPSTQNGSIVDILSEGMWDHKPDDNDPGRRWIWSGRDGIVSVRVDQRIGSRTGC
jgi:hypothetical protein